MTKWKYKVVQINGNNEFREGCLNAYGKHGWEVVAVHEGEGSLGARVTMKQPDEKFERYVDLGPG